MKITNPLAGLSIAWQAAILAVGLIMVVLAYNFVDDFFSAEDETVAELSENQAEAAIESGTDAVNTISNQYTHEIERTNTTERIIERVQESDNYVNSHYIGAQRLCDSANICSENVVQQPSTD